LVAAHSHPELGAARWVFLRFACVAGLALIIAGVAIVYVTGHNSIKRAESEAAYDARYTSQTVVIKNLRPEDFMVAAKGKARARLDAFLKEFVLHAPILRVKMYSPTGLITYSNDHRLIGGQTDDIGELREVLAGKPVSDVSNLNKEGGDGANLKVLEVYVPVHFQNGTRGVFELYSDYAPVSARIKAEQRPIILGLGITFPLLFLALFPLLLQVTRTLRERSGRLIERTEELRQTLEKQKSAEEQLAQSQKMEAVGRLAGGVAHDFNNLLLVIRGYAALLLESAQEEQVDDLQEIQKASDKAASLTGQLLTFSRRSQGEYRVLDACEVVRDNESLISRLLDSLIQVEVSVSEDPHYVCADAGQLGQILMNLAVNARDAMPQGGRLSIAVSNAKVLERQSGIAPGDYVVLAVSDTGCGMDEQTQAKIFEPFYTTKETGKGTGLGLSIVYGLVTQAGGYINVLSAPGRGTTFFVYLPQVDAPAAYQAEEPDIVEDGAASGTVLIAEDEPAVLGLLSAALEKAGYNVLEAVNGAAALDVCDRYPEAIDLLLTDIVMPEVGGAELAERVAELRPDTKVIYMSGYLDQPYQLKDGTLISECEQFLQKPFDIPVLLTLVRATLDGASTTVVSR
jgi:signal transduction histidine kinase/ActR/RegA family two-component response regulator